MTAGEEILDAPIVVGLLAAGTGDDPAAQSGELEGLREMPEGVAVFVEMHFDFRPGDTGFESCQLGKLVQRKQVVEARKVHGQDRSVPWEGVDVPDHAGPAAVWDDFYAGILGVIQKLAHLNIRDRISDPLRESADLAGTQGDPIRQGLAASVTQTIFRIDGNQGVKGNVGGGTDGSSSSRVASSRRAPMPSRSAR